MPTQQATYDRTYLTDPAKLRELALWILGSKSPIAARARQAMHVRDLHPSPSQSLVRSVYTYLFSITEESAGTIVRAFTAPRPAPPKRR